MKFNDFNYCLCPMSQKALRDSKGFSGGNISTDGKWIIGDKKTKEMFGWVNFDPEIIPQYMKDLGIKHCCLSHELAHKLVRVMASKKGASDGWYFFELDS